MTEPAARSVMDRVWEVYLAADPPRGDAHVRPDLSGWRWRISSDVRTELQAHASAATGAPVPNDLPMRLLAIPAVVDRELPPNSMILERGE